MSKTFLVDGKFDVEASGDITLQSTTGSVSLQGNSGPTVFSGDVTITGNLDIQGSTTTVDTINTNIKDNVIVINSGESGAGITNGVSGIQVDRGSLTDVVIRYNETTDLWELTNDGSTYAQIVTSSTSGVFLADVVDDITPQLGGDLDVNGQSIVTTGNGNIVLAPDGTGDVLPGSDSAFDFGANATRWATIYADTVDGTTLTGTLSTATQNSVTTMTGLVTTGALNSGSIATGFGNIDNGTSNITSGGVWTIDVDGSAIGAAGSLNFGAAGNDAAIYWNATNLEIDTTNGIDISVSGVVQANMDVAGDWNFQANNLTTTGDISATNVSGTLTTAAQPNITSLGTLTSLDVDYISIDGNRISSNTTNSNITLDPNGTGLIEMIGTNGFVPPRGTTGERPGAPADGQTRFNTTTGKLEFWNTASWEASGVTITGEIFGDTFTGDGSTAAFTISQTTDSDIELFITINGVVQEPTTAYSASGAVVTFTSAPADGDSIVIRNLYAAQGVTQIIDADSDTYVRVQNLAVDTDSIDFHAGGVDIGDMTSAGLQMGGAGARVTTIYDTDAMTEDSDTALATQQSIKAFVDNSIAAINSITEGDTDITISDAGAGTITMTVDAGTQLTLNASTADFQDNAITTTGVVSGIGSGLTALTAANISSGNLGSGVLPYSTASSTASAFKVMFANTTADASGNFGPLIDSGTGEFTYNPSTNTFTVGAITVNSGDILRSSGASSIQNIGSAADKWTNIYADQFHGTATKALYADVAERYEADAEYYPGDVVVFGGEKEITLVTSYNDHRIAGVISASPAYAMNEMAGTNETHPYVGLVGRVPCKVHGNIRKGDPLIASGIHHGVATSRDENTNFAPGTIVGKALEDYNSDEVGMIEVVLGLS